MSKCEHKVVRHSLCPIDRKEKEKENGLKTKTF